MRILLRHCRLIDAERNKENGRSVEAMCRVLASRFRQRRYRCAPSHRVRLSPQTIRRSYYTWRKAKRAVSALALQYVSTTPRSHVLTLKQIARIHRMLADVNTVSFAQIFRALFPQGGASDWFYDRFTAEFRRKARAMFLARHRQQRTERIFTSAITKGVTL